MSLKTRSAPVLLLALALALGACGGEEAPTGAGTTSSPPVASAPATTAATSPPPASETTTGSTAPPRARAPRPARERPAPAATTTTPAPEAQAGEPESQPEPASTQARAPEPQAEPVPDPEPAGTQLDELAVLHLAERASPRDYTQVGTVTGTYDGTMRLTAKITDRGVLVSFVATVEGGTIEGSGVTRPIITGKPLAGIAGTMDVTGGSGRFASMRGRRLAVTGHARLDGTYTRVRLAGTVTY